MMKKSIAVILAIVTVILCLTACGNMSLGMGNYEYNKIHIDTYHYSGCFTVVKWYDASNGIEVLTKEAGSMFFAEGTYILISGDTECPFCQHEE